MLLIIVFLRYFIGGHMPLFYEHIWTFFNFKISSYFEPDSAARRGSDAGIVTDERY